MIAPLAYQNSGGVISFSEYQEHLQAIAKTLWAEYLKTRETGFKSLYTAYTQAFWEGQNHAYTINR